nr:AAA family ATPase [Collinsella intestinalis]
MSDERGYFFFDEIQNVEHWEKFVRRLADAGERVYITGSNATMLSRQISSTLGGRFFPLHVTPFRFDEFLDAKQQAHSPATLYTTREIGRIVRHFDTF